MNFNDKDSLYNVFYQVIRLHYHRTHMMLDKIGVYPGQPPMLYFLEKEDGQSQKDLADKLNVKPATITVMLNRMEKSGLVLRKQDDEDQRISRVYITEKGKEVYKQVEETMSSIESECFYNFTEEEKIVLRRLFMQMRDNLKNVCEDESEGDI